MLKWRRTRDSKWNFTTHKTVVRTIFHTYFVCNNGHSGAKPEISVDSLYFLVEKKRNTFFYKYSFFFAQTLLILVCTSFLKNDEKTIRTDICRMPILNFFKKCRNLPPARLRVFCVRKKTHAIIIYMKIKHGKQKTEK